MSKNIEAIRAKRFRSVFRGVHRGEVQAFLAVAVDDYAATIAELARLRAELAGVTGSLNATRDHERESTRALSRAEDDARGIRERTAKQVQEIAERAHRQAAALLHDVEAERVALLDQIARCGDRQARTAQILQAEIEALAHEGSVIAANLGAVTAVNAADVTAANAEDVTDADLMATVSWSTFHTIGAPAEPVALLNPALTSTGPAPVSDSFVAASDRVTPAAADRVTSDVSVPAISEVDDDTVAQRLSPMEPRSDFREGPGSPSKLDAIAELTPAQLETSLASFLAEPWPAAREDQETIEDRGMPVAPESRRRSMRAWVLLAACLAGAAVLGAIALTRGPAGPLPATVEAAPAQARQKRAAGPSSPDAARSANAATSAAVNGPIGPPPADGIRVRLEATQPCWIRITIGEHTESRLLVPGEAITRDSNTDLVVRAGNAGALRVTVNDRLMPPIGGDGEVVTRRITRPTVVSGR
jgi:DivIVA domain-containing protein